MEIGKYFDSLVESTIRIASALETKDVSKQLDLFCKTVIDLTKNLENLSKDSRVAQISLDKIDHTANLRYQVQIANTLIPAVITTISLAKNIPVDQITSIRFGRLKFIKEKLKKSISILREGYQRYHLNPAFYSHGFDGNELKTITNELSDLLMQMNPIITRFKNNL